MQVRKLSLSNFQAHEWLEIEFSPTITSIQGESDRGKSAVLRALRWVCLNDFAGAEFIRRGASEAEVSLRSGKLVITRKRGTKENTYSLDAHQFKAFGNGVPEPIAQQLKL